jgi:hypothetical protein
VERVARDVPADGNPSRRTGQTFTCRVWIGDVIAELGRAGVLELKKSIGEYPGSHDGEKRVVKERLVADALAAEIEMDAIFHAKEGEMDVVTKRKTAIIVTDTRASSF